MTLSEIYKPIRSELQAAEALLSKELALRDGLLGEMTRYISKMPGKRIRPALALLAAQVAGTLHLGTVYPKRSISTGRLSPSSKARVSQNGASPILLAVAVEMIHTATLLHDDVIDGASLRRGLTTLNAKWGDTLSVLSGDYLYSKAFCLLGELGNQQVLSLLSDTARIVCEGEVAQIHHQKDIALSRKRYLAIIQWKTASLMEASAQAGALLGGATPAQADRLALFGMNFGLAFQIMDDTQDLIGKEADLGKSLGTDLGQGQMTLPLIYLRDAAKGQTLERLREFFNGNGSHAAVSKEELYQLLQKEALRYEVPAYCKRTCNRYLAKARQALDAFSASDAKSSLLALTDYLVL
jgi:octaprenyl-diphosphate synthase